MISQSNTIFDSIRCSRGSRIRGLNVFAIELLILQYSSAYIFDRAKCAFLVIFLNLALYIRFSSTNTDLFICVLRSSILAIYSPYPLDLLLKFIALNQQRITMMDERRKSGGWVMEFINHSHHSQIQNILGPNYMQNDKRFPNGSLRNSIVRSIISLFANQKRYTYIDATSMETCAFHHKQHLLRFRPFISFQGKRKLYLDKFSYFRNCVATKPVYLMRDC